MKAAAASVLADTEAAYSAKQANLAKAAQQASLLERLQAVQMWDVQKKTWIPAAPVDATVLRRDHLKDVMRQLGLAHSRKNMPELIAEITALLDGLQASAAKRVGATELGEGGAQHRLQIWQDTSNDPARRGLLCSQMVAASDPSAANGPMGGAEWGGLEVDDLFAEEPDELVLANGLRVAASVGVEVQ